MEPYFISGSYTDQTGTLNSNALQRANSRANFVTRPRDDLSISFSGGYVSDTVSRRTTTTPSASRRKGCSGTARPSSITGGTTTRNRQQFSNAIRTFQGIQKITPALNATYTPLKWLSFLATGGMDLTTESNVQSLAPNILNALGNPYNIGFAQRNQLQNEDYTIALTGTATVPITHDLQSKTSIGGTWRRELLSGNYAYGAGLLLGTSTAGTGPPRHRP